MATRTERNSNPHLESLKQEVYALLEKHGTEDWDGEGALPLSTGTVDLAQRLVDGFPQYLGKPDISASPQGEVDFDWATPDMQMLTVSVCPSNEVAFAALFNDTLLSGTAQWNDNIPRFVQSCFERLHESLE